MSAMNEYETLLETAQSLVEALSVRTSLIKNRASGTFTETSPLGKERQLRVTLQIENGEVSLPIYQVEPLEK